MEHAWLKLFLSQTIDAQERERQYLARELHDETLQDLVDIAHKIDELAEGEDIPRNLSGLRILRNDVDSVLETTRRFTLGLRPPLLDEMGLGSSLRLLAQEIANEQDMELDVEIHGEEKRLSENVELSMFRIAQEALHNIKRHSRATRISLDLENNTSKVRLKIVDNGVGFSVPVPEQLTKSGKFGLAGMAERARLVGGNVLVKSVIGKYTVVKVEIPV